MVADGDQRAGEDVHKMLETAQEVRRLMKPLTQHLPNTTVVEQAAIAGALDPEILANPENAAGCGRLYFARRLDALSPPLERGWQGAIDDTGALAFTRTLRGVPERLVIDQADHQLGRGPRFECLCVTNCRTTIRAPFNVLVAKDKEYTITGPVSSARGHIGNRPQGAVDLSL